MKRILLCLFVLAVSLSIALPFAHLSAASAQSKVNHTIIAATGAAAPTGGNYLPGSFFNVRLNAQHEVAFDASVGPAFTTGVFVGDGRTTTTVALGENPDPAVPSFGAANNPFITSNGDVVFDANFSDTWRSDGKTACFAETESARRRSHWPERTRRERPARLLRFVTSNS